jgi:hypothetical protein
MLLLVLAVVDLKVQDDLTVTGDIDVDGTTNLDVVDIDGALTQDGGAVFNETGADVDFRVESDTVDHALFVQGSDGNVGIGTSSPASKLEINGDGITVRLDGTANTTRNILMRNVGGSAEGVLQTDGNMHLLQEDASKYMRFSTANTERLRINSSGNVSIGSSFASGVATRVLTVDDPSNAAIVVAYNGATALNLYADADEANIGSYLQGANMKFFTTPSGGSTTERMRITNAGYTKMSPNGTYVSAAGSYHEVNQNIAGITSYIYNSSATGDGLLVNVNNESTYFFLAGYSDSAARYNVYIFSNGNLVNRNNSYGALSDQKLKQDIEDASSQWEDVKAMQFRKYRWKQDVAADVDAPYQLGVIAQELEASGMSGLIEESPDREFYDEVVLDSDGNPVVDEDGNNVTEQKERLTGESTKSVKYSILTMKALVALQEAMTRIESLEARITTLENA